MKDRVARRQALFLFLAACLFFRSWIAHGAIIPYINDTISTSEPGAAADQTIVFQVARSVPPGGAIVITPQAGAFSIPSDLDATDVDFATSSSPTWAWQERAL